MNNPNEPLQTEATGVFPVHNPKGLHARPASELVKLALTFQADVTLEKDEVEVNGKSILGLLMLCATKDSHIKVTCRGPDAQQALDAIGKEIERLHEYDDNEKNSP